MENYNISCDTGQDKTYWESVWRITISVVTLGNGEHKTEGQPAWRITTSVLIMDKIKLNDNQYGGLLFQFCLHKIKMNDEKTLKKIEMSGNHSMEGLHLHQYGWLQYELLGLLPQFLTPGKIQMTILRITKYVPILDKIHNEWHISVEDLLLISVPASNKVKISNNQCMCDIYRGWGRGG